MVVGVRQSEVLVEPFGAERFGRVADRLAPILKPDTRTQHGLTPMGRSGDAELERHAQPVGPLAPFDFDQPGLHDLTPAPARAVPAYRRGGR